MKHPIGPHEKAQREMREAKHAEAERQRKLIPYAGKEKYLNPNAAGLAGNKNHGRRKP